MARNACGLIRSYEATTGTHLDREVAEGIRMIREAGADEAVLTLKSLEAFARAADGKATKIIIPSDIQGIAGLASSLKEIVTDPKAETDK